MKKINVAELLKNCPKGMELNCTIYEDVVFHDIVDRHYPIRVRRKQGGLINLNSYGCMDDKIDSKCVIFPKGKTTWEGFQGPLKKGDIVVNNSNKGSNPFIYKGKGKYYYECYVGLTFGSNPNLIKGSSAWIDISCELRPATEEEKEKLFQVIKDNGYRWNSETKTLEKLIEPQFKVGDRIWLKENHNYIYPITGIKEKENKYECGVTFVLRFSEQNNWELVPDKFDITTLKPFESRVLVRNDKEQYWIPAFWGGKRIDGYITTFGWCKYCIPFEGNEHLFETNNDCDEFFKTWK